MTTRIIFYSGSRDKLETACRLCAKAVQQNMGMLVYVPDALVRDELDKLLWTFSATSFVAHCDIRDADLIGMTPVVLTDRIVADAKFTVLLNLHQQCPPEYESFERLIEIAGEIDQDKQAARERYRIYKEAGHEIQHYNLTD